jgi:hypothetical protein
MGWSRPPSVCNLFRCPLPLFGRLQTCYPLHQFHKIGIGHFALGVTSQKALFHFVTFETCTIGFEVKHRQFLQNAGVLETLSVAIVTKLFQNLGFEISRECSGTFGCHGSFPVDLISVGHGVGAGMPPVCHLGDWFRSCPPSPDDHKRQRRPCHSEDTLWRI